MHDILNFHEIKFLFYNYNFFFLKKNYSRIFETKII